MFVNYFWQQCVIGVRDGLGHLSGLLCIKFREDILMNNVAGPVLLEFAELADSPIYPPSSIQLNTWFYKIPSKSKEYTDNFSLTIA
jgi:hypothetical protein